MLSHHRQGTRCEDDAGADLQLSVARRGWAEGEGRKVIPGQRKAREFRSMKSELELIALAKTHTLETIVPQLKRSPEAILRKAARLGLSIKRTAKRTMEELPPVLSNYVNFSTMKRKQL